MYTIIIQRKIRGYISRYVGEWKYEFIDLDYDKEKVLKEMQESGLNDMAPYWCQVTKHLILSGEVSHGTVLSKAMKLCTEDGNNCAWYNVPETYWEKAFMEVRDEKTN